MEEIKLGSYEWVQGVIDWEGMPGAFEHIDAAEILDNHLSDLWERAFHIYSELSEDIRVIERYIEGKITEGE